MSSSGLIYAVIVGAWAAYLVPMWLRRQDELNEVRPTERFSTAIRLLSGRAAMERKISRQMEETQPLAMPTPLPQARASATANPVDGAEQDEAEQGEHDAAHASGAPVQAHVPPAARASEPAAGTAARQAGPSPAVASRRRAALLARRRRMVVILFAAFTAGMVVAAVGGIALLWIPAVPAVLFSAYIAQMRRQEHRRYEVKLDRRRAAEAAQHVRQRAAARREAETAALRVEAGREARAPRAAAQPSHPQPSHPQPPHAQPHAAPDRGREAEQSAGHGVGPTTSGTGTLGAGRAGRAEPWADDDRPEHAGPTAASTSPADQGWDPVPVPLPTYVTAPVAPRATLGLDLSGPDTYSAARARQTPPSQQAPPSQPPSRQQPQARPNPAPRRPAPKSATPLFDQYADDTPRAANE